MTFRSQCNVPVPPTSTLWPGKSRALPFCNRERRGQAAAIGVFDVAFKSENALLFSFPGKFVLIRHSICSKKTNIYIAQEVLNAQSPSRYSTLPNELVRFTVKRTLRINASSERTTRLGRGVFSQCSDLYTFSNRSILFQEKIIIHAGTEARRRWKSALKVPS